MRTIATAIPGVLICEPAVRADPRGFFLESFNQRDFEAAIGRSVTFVQDNLSRSPRGVLRGLHYQVAPAAQGKLVGAVRGRIFDVAVDLRRHSPAFGQWVGVELDDEHHRRLWVPEGCAHGFQVLSDTADVMYKVSEYYAPHLERGIAWDDPQLAIDWPLRERPTLSPKDVAAGPFASAEIFP